MKIWVLTREENQYDQYGEYYVKAFKEKPTKEDLFPILNPPYTPSWSRKEVTPVYDPEEEYPLLDHIIAGGGRRYPEDTWYNLLEEKI